MLLSLVVCSFHGVTEAALIDITDPALAHFGDFPHFNTPGDYSNISKDFVSSAGYADFGWHYSPSNHGSAIGGILLSDPYQVTRLSLQVHSNPFKDFLLQGSTNTTDGFNGDWDTLLSSTVTLRSEFGVQSWDVDNNTAYSAYRINILNDYTAEGHGWAMYRWELLADNTPAAPTATPEPASLLLFSLGGAGLAFRRRFQN